MGLLVGFQLRFVMKALFCAFVFALVGGMATASAAASGKKGAVVPEQALEGFFADLDAKSTSLVARREDEFAEMPAFKNRDELLAKLAARLSRIDALRARGAVGESNRGFLEERGTVTAQERGAISEENADRTAVYEAVAELAKVHVDEVGRLRAKKVAIMSKRRAWVQDAGGEWRQKI